MLQQLRTLPHELLPPQPRHVLSRSGIRRVQQLRESDDGATRPSWVSATGSCCAWLVPMPTPSDSPSPLCNVPSIPTVSSIINPTEAYNTNMHGVRQRKGANAYTAPPRLHSSPTMQLSLPAISVPVIPAPNTAAHQAVSYS